MELELVKTRKYNLEPFGKFIIKFKTKQGHLLHVIPYGELKQDWATAMPLNPEQDKEIVKFMKKTKTDILTDGEKYYTRSGYSNNIDLVEVKHWKFDEYKNKPFLHEEEEEG